MKVILVAKTTAGKLPPKRRIHADAPLDHAVVDADHRRDRAPADMEVEYCIRVAHRGRDHNLAAGPGKRIDEHKADTTKRIDEVKADFNKKVDDLKDTDDEQWRKIGEHSTDIATIKGRMNGKANGATV
jgi:hypothetical protein